MVEKISITNNIWKKCPVKFYRAPVAWTRWFFRTVKMAHQRATKGYCDSDLWNLNDYYATLFYHSLHELADNAVGHPKSYEDKPEGEWSKDLHSLANQFKLWICDDDFLWENYWDRFHELEEMHPDGTTYGLEHIDPVLHALKEKAVRDEAEFENAKRIDVKCGLSIMGEWFHNLWD